MAGQPGALARKIGIPTRRRTMSMSTSCESGTCNQVLVTRDAMHLAVLTKTSASASGLGSEFSNVNRILKSRDGLDSISPTWFKPLLVLTGLAEKPVFASGAERRPHRG